MKDTSDDQPKTTPTKQPATPKLEFFLPGSGHSVEAKSMEDAVSNETKRSKQEKVGDE